MAKCKQCAQWQIKGTDDYCGYCGFLQMPIVIEPMELKMISEIVTSKDITFSIIGEGDMDIEILPQGQELTGFAFLPSEGFSVGAKKSTVIKAQLDESLLAPDFSAQSIKYICRINKDERKTVLLSVHIKAGPKPVAFTGEIRFGDVQEGKRIESWLEIGNKGGIPLKFKEALVEGSPQFQLQIPRALNLLGPDDRVKIPIIWESPTFDPSINRLLVGVRLRFTNSSKELFVPIKGELFRFKLAVSPTSIHISEVLCKQTYTERIQLTNHGTKDIEVTAIESDQEWIQIMSSTSTFTLLCKDSPRKAALSSTIYSEKYTFEVVLKPQKLKAGTHKGRVIVRTIQEDIRIEIPVNIFVIHPKKCHEYIGIDFGTTNSVVAIMDINKDDFLLVDEENPISQTKTHLIPSVLVFFGSEDNYKIGSEAEREAPIYPEMTVRSIKRIMGYGTKRVFFEKTFSPEAIASLIIKRLVQYAEKFLYQLNKEGKGTYLDISKAIVTVPANFYDVQINGILEACQKAGIDTEEKKQKEITEKVKNNIGHEINAGIILDEPSAAALFYLRQFQEDGKFDTIVKDKLSKNENLRMLIFDYGGGTLDVSIVQIIDMSNGNLGIKILATKGDNNIGGDSIDITIMKALLKICRQQLLFKEFDHTLISDNFNKLEEKRQKENWPQRTWSEVLRARGKWKKAAENLKIALDSKFEVEFKINEDAIDNMADIFVLENGKFHAIKEAFKTKVTQDLVKQWISNILNRCQEVVTEALDLAEIKPDQMDYIIHTGRSSLMPVIREKVKMLFPTLPQSADILDKKSIKVCVAQGAALYGQHHAGIQTSSHAFLMNGGRRLPHSYGVQVQDFLVARYEPLIKIGTEYPTEATKHYPPNPSNRELNLKIFQNAGKNNQLKNNPGLRLIGSKPIDTMANNLPGCDVKIIIAANRKLEVTANGIPVEIDPARPEEEDRWLN